MKHLFILTVPIALFIALSCCKDDKEPDPNEPPVFPYVEVFTPCDTADGVSNAIKISAEWTAAATCRSIVSAGKKRWVIELITCTEFGEFRENILFGSVPDENPLQRFPLHINGDSIAHGLLTSRYVRITADGDVLEDYYFLDSAATDNYLQIDRWDREKKEAEGRFRVSYNIRQPRYNPANPEKVRFWKGQFRMRLPE